MKKVSLTFIIWILLSNVLYCQISNSSWIGKYSYDVPVPITFSLTIKDDNTCIYEGVGIQTFFEVTCKGKVNGDKYDIYFLKTTKGAYLSEDWIDKNKPIITLSYSENVLYTYEPQHDFDKKGPKKTYKKIY